MTTKNTLSVNDLTMGEVKNLEKLIGKGIQSFADEEKLFLGELSWALYYLFKKREDPTFTVNQAEAATFAEVQAFLGAEEDDEE